MEKLEIKGDVRVPGKKGASHKLRAAGRIPVVCYGRNTETVSASIDPAELNKVLSTDFGPNIVFSFVCGDAARDVMVKSVQRDPVSRRILHADFYCVDADRKVTVRVPLSLTGKSVGVGKGGTLRKAAREVVVSCLPKDIPVVIEFDVTPLDLKDRAQISRVPVVSGCEYIYDNDYLVAEVIPPRAN
ncbi:MAG: 50S ribosomal protein L25 [Proteobacteria bacterium]|jgi:large subunit ribosomal protein L25|nr:50S ribosomal protein L25 [Pseudomonadota bacterium]